MAKRFLDILDNPGPRGGRDSGSGGGTANTIATSGGRGSGGEGGTAKAAVPRTIKTRFRGEMHDMPILEVGKTFKNGKTTIRVERPDGSRVWLNTKNMETMER